MAIKKKNAHITGNSFSILCKSKVTIRKISKVPHPYKVSRRCLTSDGLNDSGQVEDALAADALDAAAEQSGHDGQGHDGKPEDHEEERGLPADGEDRGVRGHALDVEVAAVVTAEEPRAPVVDAHCRRVQLRAVCWKMSRGEL